MNPNQPDWNISELYSRAWQVVKKNKILWVFGAAAGVGSSYNFRSTNFNSDDFQKFFSNPNTPSTPNLPNEISAVLGASTNNPFTNALFHIFSSVPLYLYVLGAFEFFLLILMGLAISVIYKAWTQGMLLQGTATGLADKSITITDTSKQVLPKLKSLLWLDIVPGLIFFLAIFVIAMVATLTIVLIPFPIKLLFIILTVIAFGAIIYWAIFLATSLIWAPREILLNNKSGKSSLIAGYKISKKKLWPSLLLGVVNTILSIIIFIVPIIVIIAVFAGLIFAGIKNPTAIVPVIITGFLLAIPIIVGFILLGGIITSFKATVWTDAYLKIKGKYHD